MEFGGTCWYCHWGWPKAIRDIYERGRDRIDELLADAVNEASDWTSPEEPTSGEMAMEFGPAHCVWSDENFDGNMEWCLKNCDNSSFANWHPGTMEAVRQSLLELAALPEEIRNPPKGYNGNNPEKYPPPAEWQCKKR